MIIARAYNEAVTRYKSLDEAPEGLRKLFEAQYGSAKPKAKRTKYGNVRTEFNGETYDSKAEAQDEQAFALRQAAGEIGGYARQVSVPLRGATRGRGTRHKVDWLVNEPRPHTCSNCRHVDPVMGLCFKETKGLMTRASETKRRLLEAQLGVKIEIIQH